MSKAGDTLGDLHADRGEFNHQRKSLISNEPDIGDLQRLLTKIAIAALGTHLTIFADRRDRRINLKVCRRLYRRGFFM